MHDNTGNNTGVGHGLTVPVAGLFIALVLFSVCYLFDWLFFVGFSLQASLTLGAVIGGFLAGALARHTAIGGVIVAALSVTALLLSSPVQSAWLLALTVLLAGGLAEWRSWLEMNPLVRRICLVGGMAALAAVALKLG